MDRTTLKEALKNVTAEMLGSDADEIDVIAYKSVLESVWPQDHDLDRGVEDAELTETELDRLETDVLEGRKVDMRGRTFVKLSDQLRAVVS